MNNLFNTYDNLILFLDFVESTKKHSQLSASKQNVINAFIAAGFMELDEDDYVKMTSNGEALHEEVLFRFEQTARLLAYYL